MYGKQVIQVLPDYFVWLPCNTDVGIAGEVIHEYQTPKGNGAWTWTGHILAYVEEPTEIRARHWHVDLFLRSDVHYSSWRNTATIAQGGEARPPHYHRDLPRAVGEMLLERTACTEPMGLTVSLFRHSSVFLEFGETWLEDEG